ncbi:HNH endonuclease [Enterobacter hormaechei]|nr:HNH endonuclease [Enterobacter hormaechei]
MAKRITITKSTRFEVFKRDKFTCQYCGRKAPDVVLNVDHIEPVSKGGGNEIINLVTSCFDCNNGKRDKKLDDNSVVEKQRKQLELLQERREQMELMIEWKKSLSSLADDTTNLILDYVNSKIPSFSVNESGRKAIEKWIKDFSINDILDSIDQAAIKYLKYNEGKLTPESVQEYFNKIAGITAVKNMPLLKQKLAYIKGICRNRFNYWDAKKGTSILTDYVKALEDYGWNENQIIHDLETEVMKKRKVQPIGQNGEIFWKDGQRILKSGTNNNQNQNTKICLHDIIRLKLQTKILKSMQSVILVLQKTKLKC